MKNKTKGQVYAEAFESIRNITKLYLSNVEDNFLRTRYEINGAKLNSAYWINAHLVWAEHYLIVRQAYSPSEGVVFRHRVNL